MDNRHLIVSGPRLRESLEVTQRVLIVAILRLCLKALIPPRPGTGGGDHSQACQVGRRHINSKQRQQQQQQQQRACMHA